MARAREARGAERGFFMVWFAFMFVTLISFAGLALEFNRWQNLGTRIQKAADAAALAGAVFLPDNLPQAQTTAKATASKNGYTHAVDGVTITAAKGKLPNQLKVTISVPTKNPWGAIVGYGNSTIVRSAVAEYQLPQNLGSPQNSYGNNPESPPAGGQPQFWGNIFGPGSAKGKGDAYQSALCGGGVDNCPNAGTNADYDANGYFYGIEVPTGSVGALNVQVFDPAFVAVGDNCVDQNGTGYTAALNNAASLTAAQIPGYSGSVTPATRYASGAGSAYCTGDMSYYSDSNNNANPWTTWTLRSPDASGWDPTNNPIVCQAEFPGVFPETSNDLPTGTADANRLKALLQQNTNYAGVSPAMRFNQFFRQWVTLCSISSPTPGTYFLEVQTNKKIDGTAAPNAGGSNRYAIQVGLGTNYAVSNGLRLYGNGRMGVYANATGADTRFYLTRILPGEAGKTLVLQFFDTGDASLAAGQFGTITVLPPPDSNVTSGTFTGCKYTAPPGNSTGPPWGTLTATASGCAVTGVSSSAGWDGQWVTYEIPIPANYDCDDTSPTGCWTRLRFSYPSGTSVQDTTSWVAYVLGEPVRLIQ
ncbi:MAG TPA: pilus assembly protein TadG-related protein [Acidimicrobiia bacterium]|nr:pilus assembly protein TadG-related protein [Acidimicrobiia bacterium]